MNNRNRSMSSNGSRTGVGATTIGATIGAAVVGTAEAALLATLGEATGTAIVE